jgi:hypothetical protein
VPVGVGVIVGVDVAVGRVVSVAVGVDVPVSGSVEFVTCPGFNPTWASFIGLTEQAAVITSRINIKYQ